MAGVSDCGGSSVRTYWHNLSSQWWPVNKHLPILSLWLLAIVSAHADNAAVPPQKLKARPDGTIEGPAFAIPFSTFASEQAKHALLDRIATPSPVIPGDAPKTRRNIDDQYRRTLLPS